MGSLINDEYIVPVIREHSATGDLKEYFRRRKEETTTRKSVYVTYDQDVQSEIIISDPKISKRFDMLNDYGKYMNLDDHSVRDEFKKLYMNDILSGNNCKYSLKNILKTYHYEDRLPSDMMKEAEKEYFSRSTVVIMLRDKIGQRSVRKLLENRITWLYLKATSNAYESGFYCSLNSPLGMSLTENLPGMINALGCIGIDTNAVRKLSFYDIYKIKKSVVYNEFIKTFKHITATMLSDDKLNGEKVSSAVLTKKIQSYGSGLSQFIMNIVYNGFLSVDGSMILELMKGNPVGGVSGFMAAVVTGVSKILLVVLEKHDRSLLNFKKYFRDYIQGIDDANVINTGGKR